MCYRMECSEWVVNYIFSSKVFVRKLVHATLLINLSYFLRGKCSFSTKFLPMGHYSISTKPDYLNHELIQTLLGKSLAVARVLGISVARVPALLIRRYS